MSFFLYFCIDTIPEDDCFRNLFGNNIDVVQSIVCHVERSETSRKRLLPSPCTRFFRRYALSEWTQHGEKTFMDNCYIISFIFATDRNDQNFIRYEKQQHTWSRSEDHSRSTVPVRGIPGTLSGLVAVGAVSGIKHEGRVCGSHLFL